MGTVPVRQKETVEAENNGDIVVLHSLGEVSTEFLELSGDELTFIVSNYLLRHSKSGKCLNETEESGGGG